MATSMASTRSDRSRLAFAVACELVRSGIDDEFIARVLMTTKCGAHVQESPAYRLPRTLRRAHEFAIDPDLEEMNSKHAVLPIGDKTRVVTWGDDHDFPVARQSSGRKSSPILGTCIPTNARRCGQSVKMESAREEKRFLSVHWWLRHPQRRQYDGGQKFMPQTQH